MATEGDVKDPISATLNEVEHKEIISDFSNTIINKFVTEEKEKVESWTSQPSETVTILPRTEKGQVTNDVENEKVEIDYEGHTGSTVGELFLQPPPVVTGFLKKDKGEIQWSPKQGAHSLQEENEGISNDVIVSVGNIKTETWQDENSGDGKILVQGNEPTEEILESSKTGAAEQIQEIIESPYAEINTYTEKEESVDHLKEVTDDINKIPPEEQNSLPTVNTDEKASTELTYFPNEEALQLEGIDHDKVHTNTKGQADETFEVHQEEKHEQGNNEADKGPEGTEKIEMAPSTKAYENEDAEQQEKDPNTETETETATVGTAGIERYQTSIEVETNAIKELDPSIVLEEEERSLKIPIITEKEVREPNIKCTGKTSDKEFTEEVESMTPNYETLSEGLNKQSHLETSEGEIASQEKSLDDGKASSDPEASKDEIDQPTASKDEKPLDILEEEELSNMAPERDKTGNNMPVKDDQLQFEGCSITVADNEEAVFEKHVSASSSLKEDIEIEKRAELDVEAQVHVSEAEAGSSSTVTEKVISYTEGSRIPLEQNIESLDRSNELKLVAGSLANDDEINTTERNNLEESYNNQTGSTTEQTTVQDNKGDENDTNEDTQSSSVGQEEHGKAEEKTLTEEIAERLDEVDENELHKEKTQKEENTEDLHVMEEVNEPLKQTVPDSTASHDHEAIYFDSGFSEDNITEDLGQHAEELSMSTESEQERLKAVEKPEDFTTITSDASKEKIKDEKVEQEINYDANNDDAPTMIIEETFSEEAQLDHYSLKEAHAISCEKHENVTIERSSSLVSQPQVVDPQCQDFERVPNVETPLAHETRQLQVDEDPKDGDDQSAKVDTNDYAENLEVVPSIESPLVLEESKNTILEQLVKDNAELKESEVAPGSDNKVQERSLEVFPCQTAPKVDKVEEIEKISELQSQDFERVAEVETLDVQTPLAHESGVLHVDLNDEDDDTANKTGKDYVADLEVAPAIYSPLELEESNKATLENIVKDKVNLEESEVEPGSDNQVKERSLEVFPGQTAPEIYEVKEIDKISEPRCQDIEIVADVETLDVQRPLAHETGLLHVDLIDGDDDTVKDYVADLEVAHAIESPLVLEETKTATLKNIVKDKVDLEESDVAPGSDDKVQERSFEVFPVQTAPEVDRVEEIEKISEPQFKDFETIAEVETLNAKTPPAHETGLFHVDLNDGNVDTATKSVKDYVADLEVAPTIDSPLELEESNKATLENIVKSKVDLEESDIAHGSGDQVQESSHEVFPGQTAPEVDEIKEIDKISEPQCQDVEIVADVETLDVQTPLAHESGLLHVDLNDEDDDTANKTVKDYVADLDVAHAIESPLVLEESEIATLENIVKDKIDLKESDVAPGSDDNVQDRSLEVFPVQTAPEVEKVEEIEKISEPQSQDFERTAEVETLDAKTPPAHETGLLNVDLNDGNDDTATKSVKDYVADLEVAPTIDSPLGLEESKTATLENIGKDKVDLAESEVVPGSDDKVQEKSLEVFPGQTAPEVDEVEEIEQISEPQCQNLEIVADVETLDVKAPLAHETGLLHLDLNDEDDDTANKTVKGYVADLKVVHAIESSLVLEESTTVTLENIVKDSVDLEESEVAPGTDDQVQERSYEVFPGQTATEIYEVKEIEKISEPQFQDHEIVVEVETLDVQTPLAHKTRLLHEDLIDGDDDTANKTVKDYVADLEVAHAIESPLVLEETKTATLENIVKDKVDLEESIVAPGSDDKVQERSLEVFAVQTALEVDKVEEIEKISEPQSQDFERIAEVETLDAKTPPPHESHIFHADLNDGNDDTATKSVKDYVADLEVVPTIDSPLELEERNKENLENIVKDKVDLEESDIAHEYDDQVQESSHEVFPGQRAPEVDEVKEIEKISEPQCQDLEIIADVEIIDVQTPLSHESGQLPLDLDVAHAIESPLVLEESKTETLENIVKDNVDLEESEVATGLDDKEQENSLEGFSGQTAPEVDELKEIEKISEPQSQDYERVAGIETLDAKTPLAHETGLLQVDVNDENDYTANKTVKDYVVDLEKAHAIESPLVLEESNKATLENIVKDKVDLEESEVAPGSDDQVQERSLDVFTGQTAPEVDEVEEIVKISEPQCQYLEIVADVETLDVQTPLAHETGLLHVDLNDEDDDTANKNVKDYVADLDVAQIIESPLVLEENKKATIENIVKDKVDLEESEVAPGSDDKVQEKSLEVFPVQTAPEVDELKEIEKISEPQSLDFERVAAVETLDAKTPLAHETGLFQVDLNDDTANKTVKDYVADLETDHAIESPLVLEESKIETLENIVKDKVDLEESEVAPGSKDQVQERSLDVFTGQTAPEVDEVQEIEKISEPQCQDLEIVADVETLDVQTPLAHKIGLLHVDLNDGDEDTANKNVKDYVADLDVAHTIESPLVLEENKTTTLENIVKDKVDLEESEVAPESDDKVQEKSLEVFPGQTAPEVDELMEIEKISEPQSLDFERVAAVETLDAKTPLSDETRLFQVDLNDENDVADLEKAQAIESPLMLEESNKATLENIVKDKVDLEESEVAPGSDDQVQERSLDVFPGQTAPEVDEVEEIEKISEPQCQDLDIVADVETLDVQTPLAHETGLPYLDLNDGDDYTANKTVKDYVADLEVAHAIESPLVLEESKTATLENIVKDKVDLEESEVAPESDDNVQERPLEVFPCQTAQEVDKVGEIEKISEPQSQDFERVAEVEIPLAHETGLLHVDLNDRGDDTANKTVKDYVADLEVAPSIESPVVLEESKKTTLENIVKDKVDLEESEVAPVSDDQVQERSLEVFPGQTATEAYEVEEVEKISEPECQDLEIVADVETLDVKAPLAHEAGLLHLDLNDGDDDTANKTVKGYVADLEVAIESPLVLEESKTATLENIVEDEVDLEESEVAPESDDKVQEMSLEVFPGQTAQEVDKVEEIEKISESQSQDFERVAEVETLDVKTPLTHETGLLHVDLNDGGDDTVNKTMKDYVADLEVAPAIESPLLLEEREKAALENIVKDKVDLEESEVAPGSDDQVQERLLEVFPGQTAPEVDELKDIEKISEQQCQDLEIVADVETLDVKTPFAHETGLLHVDLNDGDDDTANKTVKDYVADLEVAPAIESPVVLEESKKATLENIVKDKVDLEESEVAPVSDDQVQERSLEIFSGQTAPDVDEVEEIPEPQCQNLELVADVETPLAHETGLLHLDLNDGDDDTANTTAKDYVADLEVAPAIESPLVLEESKIETLENIVKDKVDLEESEVAPGSVDQVQERSLEVFPGQTAPEVDEVEEIEKISEPQSREFERVAEVETLDAQTPPAHETSDKGTNIEDYVADLEVVHAIESPFAIAESENVEQEESEANDRVPERSLEDLTGQSAQDVGADEVKEIEKISEPQCQGFEGVGDVQTPIAYKIDPRDGDDDTANKVLNTEDFVADLVVVPAIESPHVLEESKNAPLEKHKDKVELKEGEIAPGFDEQVQERSLDELEIEKISEPQCQDSKRVVDVETPLSQETGLLPVDGNPEYRYDQIENKVVNAEAYVADLEVVPTTEFPVALEESKNTTLEKLVEDKAELKESEIPLGFNDQVHERSFEALPCQSVQGVDEVEEFEKISEPQCQDLETVVDVQTPTQETRLLHVDLNNGDDDIANKGVNIDDYVADLEVLPAIESPLELECEKATIEKLVKHKVDLEESEVASGSNDQAQERSLEVFPGQTAPEVDEVEEIEKISEPQCKDLEIVADVETLDVQTPAHETGLLKVDEISKNGANDTADKGTNIEDYVADLPVLHAIESPLALEESKNVEKENPEKFVNDNVEQEKNETDDRVLEKSIEDLPCQSAQDVGVDKDKETEKISEPQCQEFERIDDVQTPTVTKEDYVADLEAVSAIESPLELEESKNATLEKLYKEQAELNEGEIALESDDQVQERSLEAQRQSAQGVDEVEEIEKISEPQGENFERVANTETLDFQTNLAHETGLLHVDESPLALVESKNAEKENPEKFVNYNAEQEENEIPIESDDQIPERSLEDFPGQSAQDVGVDEVREIEKICEPQYQTPISHVDPKDGDDDTANKDLEVVPAIESLEKLLEDKADSKESETAPGFDVQVEGRSLEALPSQSGQAVHEVEEIEKLPEPQCQDFERVVDAETFDVQIPPAHETRLLQIDEDPKDGDKDTTNKGVNLEDDVADLIVVPAIESKLALAESKNAEEEKFVKDNDEQEEGEITFESDERVPERSSDDLGGQSSQDAGVDEVQEFEKMSEPQCQDLERVVDVQTPPAHETGLLEVDEDPKDGDDESAKVLKTHDYVADLEVVPTIETPLTLEETKNTSLEKLVKDTAELKESEIAPGSVDKVQEMSLDDLRGQSAHGVDEVEEIEKISESQHQDFERVVDTETLDVHETGLDENPKDGDETANKVEKTENYATELKVVPSLHLGECENVENATLGNRFKDKVEHRESEIAFQSNDKILERSLEDLSDQSAQDIGFDKVKESEKISEQPCQDFGRVTDVEILDVQTLPTNETILLSAIESPLPLEECKNTTVEKIVKFETELEEGKVESEFNDHVLERPVEALVNRSAQDAGGDEVKGIENISEPEVQDFERVAIETVDVQTLKADFKDGDEIENKIEREEREMILDSTTITEKIKIQDGEKEVFPGICEHGTLTEGEDGETNEDVEKKLETQFQDVERVATGEDVSVINVGTSSQYETGLQRNVVSQEEENETATITEKIEIQDGEKEEQGTVREGEDGETKEDVEKKFENQFQDVERVATSEASIINVVTSPQDETEIQGNVVSQEEENETSTVIEKIEIDDGEKEETVREGGAGETSKDLEKKFETQFQDVERVAASEDASIIKVGTSPHYETRLQGNEVSQEEENETETIIEKIEIQDGEKEAFKRICDQGTVTEGGDGETSEDVEKKVESQFQDIERVATNEDDSIINVGTSPQYEQGLQGKVVSQEEEPETTNTIEKIEIQDGEKEVFQGICEKGTVTEDGYGETSKDVEKKFETQFQDVERVATSEDASIIDVGFSPQYETGLQVNVVSQEEENETEKIEIQDGEKEVFPGICEQSTVTEDGDGETSEDVERVVACEDATIINFGTSSQYQPGLQGNVVSQEEKNETTTITENIEIQDGEKEAFRGTREQGTVTEGGDGETSEDVEKKFETQFQDVGRVATSKYVSTINVGTSPEYETGLGVNLASPKEENETATITENIDIRDGEKESCERSKDVSANQNTKEPIIVEAKSVSGTYYEDLVNPMEEKERDKDVKSTSVKLDLQTGEAETEVSIKPTEVLTKEEPVELATIGNERKLKETNTDSNIPIDNDEENKDQIKKSIDSPQAKNSSPDLLINKERNVDDEYVEVKERFITLEPTKISLSDLMQKSIRKAPQVADESIQKKELIDDNKEAKNEGTEIKHGEEAKTDEENDEGDDHKGQDSGSDAPVMVEASRDIDTKQTPKKSHNILSGVGSKVKHSIAKVKKVITGKSSPHPKPPSPRIDK